MEWADLASALTTAGPVGVWLLAGVALFKFLLGRGDSLAKENVNELRAQMREWKLRALRAELVVRAYQQSGARLPRRELAEQMRLHSELGDLGLFNGLIRERAGDKEDDGDE